MWELHYSDFDEPTGPAGYVLLAWGAEEVLRIVGDGRTKVDLRLLDIYGPMPTPVLENRRAAIDQATLTAGALIGQAALSGQFAVKCRAKSGGPLLDVPADHWGVDSHWRRLATSAYNHEQPWDVLAEPTHWLFVESKTFSWWTDDVRINRGQSPIWQRRFDLKAPIDHFPKPGSHVILPQDDYRNGSGESAEPRHSNGRKRGAPVQYDWEGFYRHVIFLANTNPDGLPLKQSELKGIMLDWINEHWEDEPSDSMLRRKISEIYTALNAGG